LVRAFDGDAEPLAQFVSAAGMVDMAVGEEDLLDLEADFADDLDDARHVAAGVEHDSLHAVLVIHQRAVLLQRRDGQDGGFQARHGKFRVSLSMASEPLAPLPRKYKARRPDDAPTLPAAVDAIKFTLFKRPRRAHHERV